MAFGFEPKLITHFVFVSRRVVHNNRQLRETGLMRIQGQVIEIIDQVLGFGCGG